MAVTSDSVTVGGEVVALNVGDMVGTRLIIKNSGVGNKVADLGPVDVTLGSGFELAPGETVHVQLPPSEVLYAIADPAEGTILKVLRS